jgi:hypothetical protein
MLNTEHFILLAGDPTQWDEEIAKAGTKLVEVQVDQHRRGRRSAELVKGMYGFYVRAGTGLDNPAILANTKERDGELDGSALAALNWGRAWAEADPKNREFYVRRQSGSHYDDLGDEKKYVYKGISERIPLHADKAEEFLAAGDVFNATAHAKCCISLAATGMIGTPPYQRAVRVMQTLQPGYSPDTITATLVENPQGELVQVLK